MKKFRLFLSMILLILNLNVFSQVLITEVSPPGTGSMLPEPGAVLFGSDVWIELQNLGSQPEQLNDWTIIQYSTACTPIAIMTITDTPPLIIQPNDTVVIQFWLLAGGVIYDSDINENNYGIWDILTSSFYITPEFDYFVITDSSGIEVDSVIFRQTNYTEFNTITYAINCMVNSGAWTISKQEQDILNNGEFPEHLTVITRMGYGLRRISNFDTNSASDWEAVPGSELTPGQENSGMITQEVQLFQNYPNPFYPSRNDYTIIEFYSNAEKPAKLRIYDLNGNLIRVLFDDTAKKGVNRVYWLGTNDKNKNVDSATYLISVEIGDKRVVKPMTLIR